MLYTGLQTLYNLAAMTPPILHPLTAHSLWHRNTGLLAFPQVHNRPSCLRTAARLGPCTWKASPPPPPLPIATLPDLCSNHSFSIWSLLSNIFQKAALLLSSFTISLTLLSINKKLSSLEKIHLFNI